MQRQLLLLTLLRAMKNCPEFGEAYDNNPDGPIPRKFARAFAPAKSKP